MHAGTFNVNEIFASNRRHIVPVFQRPYIWRRDRQWAPLWDDIRSVAERVLNHEAVHPQG